MPRRELLDGLDISSIEPLPPSGGNRRYWRIALTDGSELIATHGDDTAENDAFIYLSQLLAEHGVNCPTVIKTTPDGKDYLQTSVGSQSLYQNLGRRDLIEATIDLLARAHSIGNVDYRRCQSPREMNRRAIFWDLNYFKYLYLKPAFSGNLDEETLEDDFEALADIVLQLPRGLMLRDFQSRNIMIGADCSPAVIDFQGARLGPVAYDLVSFLWQGRAAFPDNLRRYMVCRYCLRRGLDHEAFASTLPPVIALRMMQVLGAYGFRGNIERRSEFIGQIPPVLDSLRTALATLPLKYLPTVI